MKIAALACWTLLMIALAGTSQAREEPNVGTSEQPLETGKGDAGRRAPPDACRQGFVWREARPDDHVCVTPATREAVREQNRTRRSRWVQGPYGPHTCVQGYVWREAFAGDDVCVPPQFRDQTRRDNQAAAQRRAR